MTYYLIKLNISSKRLRIVQALPERAIILFCAVNLKGMNAYLLAQFSRRDFIASTAQLIGSPAVRTVIYTWCRIEKQRYFSFITALDYCRHFVIPNNGFQHANGSPLASVFAIFCQFFRVSVVDVWEFASSVYYMSCEIISVDAKNSQKLPT